MYGYEWTGQNGIYRLSVNSKIEKEIRPVFKEELDYFGFNEHWTYPDTDAPLLWAEGIRRYILNGTCVAEATGGGFYTKPTIKIYTEGLNLEPIDVDALWKENERLMLGLEKTSMDFIRKTHDKYEKQGMAFAVAFSGGKDSLVLLDLVSRTLSPDEFSVVFSNTGMELSTTIQSVEKAKKHWPSLKFYEAKSHLKPTDSWEEFGPPGRRMRWCCAVHKSVPTILLLRELTGNYNIKVVVFDGVRAEESAARADRDEISVGAKNINQINCSPILKWGTSELFIYLLHNGILFNEAYRKGLFRVGCIVCPMSSAWWDGIVNDCYPDEMRELLSNVENYARATKPDSEVKKFIEQGGWKARMGGRGLQNGGNRVVEKIADDKISFSFVSKRQNWLQVCSILGPIVYRDNDIYTQLIDKQEFQFQISGETKPVVTYWPYSKMDRFVLSHLRGIANKTAYCFGCKACAVKVISNMLRSGAEPSAIATTLLERDYPSLASYMKDEMGCDDVIDEYMAWYRKNKIINRYPGDYPVQMTFDRFDARYKLMHKLQGQDCVSFWIDGFGSEYTPLFLYELKVRGIVPESVKLATALLPTETEYNHQWDEHDPMTIKWDRLDSFSHKGMPDDKSYYSCIVHQLSVFSDAAKKVEELLENHEYVVVTGDHGSSRFAALAFHQENVVPISAPKKSTARSFGRFCELDDNAGDVIALPNTVVATSNGKRYLVMDNYQHFSVSGNAAGGNTDEHDVVGEIHGGNTAEERLVSVIVIKRKQPLPPVTCKPKGGLFVTKKNGHVEKALQFSRPISTLEVSYYNKEATCTMNADGSWLVILDGVTTDDITLSVIANGRLLPNVTLKVKAQGISKNDDPFGGMGL